MFSPTLQLWVPVSSDALTCEFSATALHPRRHFTLTLAEIKFSVLIFQKTSSPRPPRHWNQQARLLLRDGGMRLWSPPPCAPSRRSPPIGPASGRRRTAACRAAPPTALRSRNRLRRRVNICTEKVTWRPALRRVLPPAAWDGGRPYYLRKQKTVPSFSEKETGLYGMEKERRMSRTPPQQPRPLLLCPLQPRPPRGAQDPPPCPNCPPRTCAQSLSWTGFRRCKRVRSFSQTAVCLPAAVCLGRSDRFQDGPRNTFISLDLENAKSILHSNFLTSSGGKQFK